jgi:hypothetical protein
MAVAESYSLPIETEAEAPSDADLAALNRNGHVHIPGALSRDDIAALEPGLRSYMTPEGLPDPFDEERPPQVGFSDLSPKVIAALTSPRLGRIAARLLEADVVRIWNFSSLYRLPGARGLPWHQDLRFIPIDTEKLVTIWVPLAEVAADMSLMVFASGSHREGQVDPADAIKRFPLVRQPALKLGDVSVHFGWTVHTALPNASRRAREVVAIVYFAEGARFAPEGRSPATERLNGYLRNAQHGDVVAGPTHPIAYSRRAA